MDYHIHTQFSDGEADYKEVIDLSIERKLKSIAITDHFDPFDKTLRNKDASYEDLYEHFNRIKVYAAHKEIEVLCGIETCTDFKGNLRISDKVFNLCDVIITSPHYIEFKGEIEKEQYFNPFYWECYKQKVLNMAEGEGHILGHPEGYLPIKEMLLPGRTTYEGRKVICGQIADRFFDEAYIKDLGSRLRKSGKAYEIHGATHTPREWVIKNLALEPIIFSIGSDAHAMNLLGANEWGYEMARKYSLKLIFDKQL